MAKALVTKNRHRGLRASKRMAEDLGAIYTDPIGHEDGVHPIISLENKSLQRFSGEKILQQAEIHTQAGKIAVARVHINGTKYHRDIILLRVSDFKYFLEFAGKDGIKT